MRTRTEVEPEIAMKTRPAIEVSSDSAACCHNHGPPPEEVDCTTAPSMTAVQHCVRRRESNNVVTLRKSGNGRRRFSVATMLALSFGALVLASVGSVLALTVGANYRNTFDLSAVARRADRRHGELLRAHMDRAGMP